MVFIYKKIECSLFYNSDLLLYFINIFRQNAGCKTCKEHNSNSYGFFFYQLYILKYPNTVLYGVGWILEIILTHERYCSLYNKKFFIKRISVKHLTLGLIIFCIIFNSSDYFAYQIKYSGQANMYLLTLTDFGKSSLFSIYVAILVFIIFLSMSISLIILNGIIINALNRNIERRTEEGKTPQSKKLNLTRIIIYVNVYYISIRFIHLVALILSRIDTLSGIESPITNIFRQVDYLLLASSYCMGIFVYAYFDKAIRKKIQEHFTSKASY